MPPLLDRQFLERLERLTIHWQKSFAGLVGGHNLSRFAGGGQEFLDHRHFHQGDDLRAVNWRAYLRLDKLFLKMYQIEPRVPVHMLLDCSRSMDAGASSKFEYAKRLAAALCYIGLVRLDTMALHPFSSHIREGKRCGGGRNQFTPVMNFLAELTAEGKTDFQGVVREFLSTHQHPGLVILISDFLDDADCLRPIQYLADFGHELLLIQLWADQDRVPPWTGDLDVVDSETGQSMQLEVDDAARAAYTRRFDEYSAALQQHAVRNGGRYVGFPVSLPLEDLIFDSLVRARGVA